jgi:DNA-binding NarL/FixJ family response regulator
VNVRHVALFYSQQLLGESLAHLLSHMADIVLVGPWLIDEHALINLASQPPDIVLIADGEPPMEQAAILATQILDTYSELSVIRITLAQNIARIYSSSSLPARTADLVEVIRRLPIQAARKQETHTDAVQDRPETSWSAEDELEQRE